MQSRGGKNEKKKDFNSDHNSFDFNYSNISYNLCKI